MKLENGKQMEGTSVNHSDQKINNLQNHFKFSDAQTHMMPEKLEKPPDQIDRTTIKLNENYATLLRSRSDNVIPKEKTQSPILKEKQNISLEEDNSFLHEKFLIKYNSQESNSNLKQSNVSSKEQITNENIEQLLKIINLKRSDPKAAENFRNKNIRILRFPIQISSNFSIGAFNKTYLLFLALNTD